MLSYDADLKSGLNITFEAGFEAKQTRGSWISD